MLQSSLRLFISLQGDFDCALLVVTQSLCRYNASERTLINHCTQFVLEGGICHLEVVCDLSYVLLELLLAAKHRTLCKRVDENLKANKRL